MPDFPPRDGSLTTGANYTITPWTDSVTGKQWIFTSKGSWRAYSTGAVGSGGDDSLGIEETSAVSALIAANAPARSAGSRFHLAAPAVTLVPSGGVLTLDMALSTTFSATLTTSVALVVTNKLRGNCVLQVTQGGGGAIQLGNGFMTMSGQQLQLPSTVGSVTQLVLICDGTDTYVAAADGWTTPSAAVTMGYEDETLTYMTVTGAKESIRNQLDAWIKGLKNINAWAGSSMWIMRSDYHASGEVIYGTGAIPYTAQVEVGSGQVTRSADEFLFEGAGARLRVLGSNLLPVEPPFSLLMVNRNPRFYTQYGAGFGGERGTAQFMVYSGWNTTDSVDKNHLFFNGTDADNAPSASVPSTTRSFKLFNVTGQLAGNHSLNGGPIVAATNSSQPTNPRYSSQTPVAPDTYASFARSLDTTVAGNPAFVVGGPMPGASACSFACLWQTDQSAKRADIYNLYRATIGFGLNLPALPP